MVLAGISIEPSFAVIAHPAQQSTQRIEYQNHLVLNKEGVVTTEQFFSFVESATT
jgi:hypothetical protein